MLVRLTVADDGTAAGHFLDYPGLFMTLRHTPERIPRPTELAPEHLHGARHTHTALDPAVLADPAFAFFCQLHLGPGRSSHHTINATTKATVVAHDGSWAQPPPTNPTASASPTTAPTTPGPPLKPPITPGPSSINPHRLHSGSPSPLTSSTCGTNTPTATGPIP
jgi:hypothetical protein